MANAIMFDQPVDHAWRRYRALLKNDDLSSSEMALAQEAFKQGWLEAELENKK